MIIIPSSTSKSLASNIAKELNATVADIERRRFPDGELYVRIINEIADEDVIVIGSTSRDEDIIEVLLLLNAAFECKPNSLRLIVPYFGYARQHMRYKNGEPISSKVFTLSLSNFSDSILTVDLHNEETLTFSLKSFRNLKVLTSITDYFSNQKIDYVVSPDDGGFERAQKIAEVIKSDSFAIDKKRIDSHTVVMNLPDIDVSDKSILLVDDIISTGGTIIKAAKALRERGASKIVVVAIHGIFAGGSEEKIVDVADELIVTDTIESRYSKISVAKELAAFMMGR